MFVCACLCAYRTYVRVCMRACINNVHKYVCTNIHIMVFCNHYFSFCICINYSGELSSISFYVMDLIQCLFRDPDIRCLLTFTSHS